MLNRTILVGRLTKDPEIKTIGKETKILNFTLACDNLSKDKDGNHTTSFINCVVWNKQAEFTANYCKKGSLVGVDGRLEQRSYDRKDGTKASVVEIQVDSVTFLEPKEKAVTEYVREEVDLPDQEPAMTDAEIKAMEEKLAKAKKNK